MGSGEAGTRVIGLLHFPSPIRRGRGPRRSALGG
jgi:hypothetical protein